MKLSRRARLRQRHYGRMHKAGGLNLVSLMDIFTILVFFLMVNSSDVKVMQNTADVPLPSSTAQQEAVENLTVQVVGQSILVQGREVARLDGIEATDTRIAGLSEELAYRRNRWADVPESGLEVTIMAAKDTDYRLLRKIMQTCVDEQFRQVRLAVESEVRNG
ncbi:ExbD/TolR family protein [Marinobacter nauticus]|uniref:ExbD/TolR family protein n=1 Tax=Marinobacter nauticus TaxID=2743 RepID=UPI001C99AA29|nr:biopolymer transporter ExbD [Marinobacter nauticus]MBY5936103.1 biopolymer transporter ExbD [Marinobacter nauticus]MBY5953332.1 biopolymer transporter ExbD [Marinobacter nauticus]MBY6007125.1 biopolymer transporter ExbD [Marinobacter nauticus]